MYDIYSNVEDPDAFYAIQNSDVMDSLLRQLNHEGQPINALGYNLAGYEATPSERRRQQRFALAHNLHDLGANKLAYDLMKKSRGDTEADKDSEALTLELAWRLSDWDVPLSRDQEATPNGRFYAALRAVHRERDREVALSVIDSTIKDEMIHLQQIGVERMTEIKQTAASLVCLRDVALWNSDPLQRAVNEGDFDGGLLKSFVALDTSFK